jgi:uncharacterized protein YoaH (UPF0181 family)
MATPVEYTNDRQALERAHSALNRALEAIQEVLDRGAVSGQALTDVTQAQTQATNARRNAFKANLRILVQQRQEEEAAATAALVAAQAELLAAP